MVGGFSSVRCTTSVTPKVPFGVTITVSVVDVDTHCSMALVVFGLLARCRLHENKSFDVTVSVTI